MGRWSIVTSGIQELIVAAPNHLQEFWNAATGFVPHLRVSRAFLGSILSIWIVDGIHGFQNAASTWLPTRVDTETDDGLSLYGWGGGADFQRDFMNSLNVLQNFHALGKIV